MIRKFFSNRPKQKNIIMFGVYLPIAILTAIMVSHYFNEQDAKRRREFEAKWKKEQVEIEHEARRRHSETKKSETGESSVEPVSQMSPEGHQPSVPAGMPLGVPPTENSDGVEIVTEGPLKGMTVEAAKAFADDYIAKEEEATLKRHKWELRKKELYARWYKNIDQKVALALSSASRVDSQLQTMLSVFKNMSDEQRAKLRQELLITKPADEVDAFFADVASASTQTPEQLQRDAQNILKSREAYKAARKELAVESEQIRLAIEEHERNKTF